MYQIQMQTMYTYFMQDVDEEEDDDEDAGEPGAAGGKGGDVDEDMEKLKDTFNSVEKMLDKFSTVYSQTHERLRNMKHMKENYCKAETTRRRRHQV